MVAEDGHEVVNMLFANVLYSKIINAKSEGNWAPSVCPKAWYKCVLVVSLCVESLFQQLLGEESRLEESIHSSPDFNVDVSVVFYFFSRL